MKLNKYDKYKNSNIPWYGDVPTSWTIERIKDVSKFVKTGRTPATSQGDFFSEGTECWFTPIDINGGEISNSTRKITKDAIETKQVDTYPAGSIFLIGIGGTLGRVGISKIKASCNQQINIINLKKNVFSKFAFYQILIIGNSLLDWCNYTTMPILNQTQTKTLTLVLPSHKEQKSIASFLDKKITAIDKKIFLLQTKISYYKELSKSLINEAVCRGLNKNEPLKESFIQWIGPIPQNWEIKRLKDTCKIINGSTPDSRNDEYWDGEINWITPADFGDEKFIHQSSRTITKAGLKSCGTTLIPEGTVIISSRAPIGSLVIAGIRLCTNQGCKALVPKKVNNLFLYYYLSMQEAILNGLGNGTTFKELSTTNLANFSIPFPPTDEQTAIADYLDNKTKTIEAIVKNITAQIDGLKELRKTLINDVVTGKLKVTEH